MTKQQMYEALLQEERNDYGADKADPRVQELVSLRVEDLNRKGCVPETYPGNECHNCGSCVDGHCPLEDWEERHPEYKDDELAKKIKALETELYGWHKPLTHKTVWLEPMTVSNLIEKLKLLPADASTSSFDVKIPLV